MICLALAGMNDDQTFFIGLCGHDLVTCLLLARHFGIVTLGIGWRISVGRILSCRWLLLFH